MSQINQTPPPSPATRAPLKQVVQQQKSGQPLPVVAVSPVKAPSPAPEDNFSKVVKLNNNVIPESMKKAIAATQQPTQTPTTPVPPVPPVNNSQTFVDPEYAPTYYEGGDETGGFIEFDLQSYRQKGVEERFLYVSVLGIVEKVGIDDQEVAEKILQNIAKTTMRITDREQFEALKNFF